jgi:hypothetical protein
VNSQSSLSAFVIDDSVKMRRGKKCQVYRVILIT